MKHYHKLFLIPCILILMLAFLSGFGPVVGHGGDPLDTLLEKRTGILQQTYYGHIAVEDAEPMLREVETQPLLNEDISHLREWEASQLDLVRKMEILERIKTAQIYDYLTYRVTIRWDMSGLSGNYRQTVEYFVVLKKSGSEYKLSEFTPIS